MNTRRHEPCTFVGAAPAFTAASPPATAVQGVAYHYAFSATGAPAPVFSVSSTFTHTAHYNDAQYAFLAKTAAHFHLAVQDVPKTGVAVIAFALVVSHRTGTKPITNVHNVGTHAISTTYSPGDNSKTMLPVEHYIVQNGDNTLYIGGLLMEYLAAIQGVS